MASAAMLLNTARDPGSGRPWIRTVHAWSVRWSLSEARFLRLGLCAAAPSGAKPVVRSARGVRFWWRLDTPA
jgi:hypothetical protein